jgi:hypothetical protein
MADAQKLHFNDIPTIGPAVAGYASEPESDWTVAENFSAFPLADDEAGAVAAVRAIVPDVEVDGVGPWGL